MFRFSHYTYCLQEESTHISLRVPVQFGPKKITNEKSTIFPIFLIIPMFHALFSMPDCADIPLCILFTYYPNYLLLGWSNSFIFHLAYTTCINLILWSNLNYEKLLKCLNTTILLRLTLDCKNLTVTYCFWFKLQNLLKCANTNNLFCY